MSEPSLPSGPKPRKGIARSLPSDLAAAYEAAGSHTLFAFTVIAVAKMATQGAVPLGAKFADGLIPRCVEFLISARATRENIELVLPELIVASEPAARFGESNAHSAAIELADSLLAFMWRTADMKGWLRSQAVSDPPYPLALIRAQILLVCRAVAKMTWPDGGAILTAIEIEAAKAAAARPPAPPLAPAPPTQVAFPPFELLLPDYVTCHGFARRIALRYQNHPLPSLPENYNDGPMFPPRDRTMELFEALNRSVYWERALDLLDFRGQRVGDFEDLVALESWGRTLLQHYIERPEDAFTVSVLLFDSPPDLRLEQPSFGSLAPGADRQVPVIDHRRDPARWEFPFTAGEGWAVSELRPRVIDQIDVRRFCRQFRWCAEQWESVPAALARCAIVHSRPGEHNQPDAVLHRLTEAIWDTMRDVSIRARLTTPTPRPASTAAPIDRFHATFDALGNWLREARRLHPEFVEPIYAKARRASEFLNHNPDPAQDDVMADTPKGPAAVNWQATVDEQVSALYCGRPNDLDPALADVFETVALAIRECARLIASVPHLWQRMDDYRTIAETISCTADRARVAYLAVDIRLRRAGGPNAVQDALNDVLTIRREAPTTPKTLDELNRVLTRVYSNRSRWFQTVDGRRIVDRMLDQLARVPSLPSAAHQERNEVTEPPVAIPPVVRNWLVARYLSNPTPDRPDGPEGRGVVYERFEPFGEFLVNCGCDVLAVAEACHSAGWIDDLRADVEALPISEGVFPPGILRLGLPVGRHRLVGIRSAVLATPVGSVPDAIPRQDPPSAAPSPYAALHALVASLRLKGREAETVLAICDGSGSAAIADLAVRFEWDNPQDNWNSTRKRLNQKFKGRGWRFATVDNSATAEQVPVTGRK